VIGLASGLRRPNGVWQKRSKPQYRERFDLALDCLRQADVASPGGIAIDGRSFL
jgi:hypothetical protein